MGPAMCESIGNMPHKSAVLGYQSLARSALIKSKSVASFEKVNMEHDITICDFADWRNHMDFFGDLQGTFNVPIPDTQKLSKVNYYNLTWHME